MPQQQHIYIDSRLRDLRYPSEQFVVHFDTPFDVSAFDEYRVQSVEIPVTWYTLPESNNAFYYSVNGGATYTRVAMTPTNYTSTRALLADLTALVTAQQATDITLAYESLTGRTRIQVSNTLTPEQFRVKMMPDSILGIGFPISRGDTETRTWQPTVTTLLADDTLYSPAVVQLDYRTSVFVTSRTLSSFSDASARVSSTGVTDMGDVIYKMQIGDNTFQNTVQRDNTDGEWTPITTTGTFIQSMDLGLRFSGNVPELNMHGAEWGITIVFRKQ